MRRSQALVALLLAATFAAGVAGGVAVDRLWLRPDAAVAEAGADGGSGERGERERRDEDDDEDDTVIERFSEELGLTRPQKARIDTILAHYRESMRKLRHEIRPRYDALVDSARRRIESVLDSAQALKYRRLLDRKGEEDDEHDGARDGGGKG